MSVPKKRRIAAGLLAALVVVICVSVASLKIATLPLPLAMLLVPGEILALALNGGNIHRVDFGTTVALNIAAWSFGLGGAAIVLFRLSVSDRIRS